VRSPRACASCSRRSPCRRRDGARAATRSRPPSPPCATTAASAEETDWPQILAWYDDLLALTKDLVHQDPAAVLGRAVAVGHVLGAAAGLRETDRLREVLGDRHRWHAVRGHLHELGGDLPAAATAYAEAARRATDAPSATTWSARPPARGPASYAGTVVSLSVLHRLAYPAMTRLSRATHRWSLQTEIR
jgi:hypothetical protein